MALTDFIPQVWSASYIRQLFPQTVWGSLTSREYDSEVSAYGNVIKVPKYTGTIQVRDLTVGTALSSTIDVANGDTVDVNIDKQKYWRFRIHDINEVQTKPDLMDRAMATASSAQAVAIDNDVRDAFNAGLANGRRVILDTATDAADWAKEYIEALTEIGKMMDNAHIPQEARYNVITPGVKELFTNYFVTNNAANTFTPATSDATVRTGFVGNLVGFNLVVTTNPISATATVSGAANTPTNRHVVGQGMQSVALAAQLTELESMRDVDHFADLVRGLTVYGTKAIEPEALFYIRTRVV